MAHFLSALIYSLCYSPSKSFSLRVPKRAKTSALYLAECFSLGIQTQMEPSPLATKPKSSVPAYLTNGTTHPAKKSDQNSTTIAAKERERLTASIFSSNKRRLLVDHMEGPNGQGGGNVSGNPNGASEFEVDARDPRDEAEAPVLPSRPESPYTLNPPIDFDGLSWPSKHRTYFWRIITGSTDSQVWEHENVGKPHQKMPKSVSQSYEAQSRRSSNV